MRFLKVAAMVALVGGLARPAAADTVTPFSGTPEAVSLADIQPHNQAPESRGNESFRETWSVVFRLDGDYSAYVQFVLTNLGLGDDKGAVQAEFKAPGGERQKDTSEFDSDEWTSAKGAFELRFGPNMLWGPLDGLALHVQNAKFTGDFRFTNLAPPWKPGSGKARYGNGGGWWRYELPAPVARVEGTVVLASDGSTHVVKGLAHVEHQAMTVGMPDQARRWARFRSIGEKTTFLLSSVQTPEEFGGTPVRFAVLFQDGKVAFQSTDVDLRESDVYHDPAKEGYGAPRLLEFSATQGATTMRGAMKATALTSREDFLQKHGAAVRFVVSRFAKPVMYYFDGTFAMEVNGPAGKVDARGKGTYYFTVMNP